MTFFYTAQRIKHHPRKAMDVVKILLLFSKSFAQRSNRMNTIDFDIFLIILFALLTKDVLSRTKFIPRDEAKSS